MLLKILFEYILSTLFSALKIPVAKTAKIADFNTSDHTKNSDDYFRP